MHSIATAMSDQDPTMFLRGEKPKADDITSFDAKKWLWIPDEATGFLAGQIKSQKGDQVVLELTNGSVSILLLLLLLLLLFNFTLVYRRLPWTSTTRSR